MVVVKDITQNPSEIDTSSVFNPGVDKASLALQALRNLNAKWLGYKFIIFSMPEGRFFNPGDASKLAIPAAGISEIEFPRVNIEMRKIPTLSTVERHIPRRVSYGDLVLRAPTIRQTTLWDKIKLQQNALRDPELYEDVPETLVIGEFETQHVLNLLPIAIWAIRGAQAKSFKPATANAQGSGIMPLEELHMQVDEVARLTAV